MTQPAIHRSATKADAILPAVVIVSLAEITRVGPATAPVAHMQLAPTMPTAEQSHQQALPGTDRRHRFVALPVHGITPDHPLILFVGGPVNISHVMIGDKDPAIFGSTHRALTLLQPTLDQQGLDRATSPNIGAGIEGIAENVADQALRGNLPDQPRSLDRVGGSSTS